MRYFLTYLILAILCLLAIKSHAQSIDTTRFVESIAVTARPTKDSITLRWAPMGTWVWRLANKNGYTIERFVMLRDGKLLSAPEKSTLTSSPLKPMPLNDWEALVKRDKYSAITAQALYGESFDVDLSKSDIMTIVNKAKENEQRYSFALFGADMSPAVAKASGLWFTDKSVKKGEKYLYRVIINNTTADSLRGSIFIGPDDPYALMKPRNLQVEVKDLTASLRWDKAMEGYTAYIVERSTDGKIFKALFDEPLVTVSPTEEKQTRYEYAIDSLPDVTQTYYYRVIGISPFGEKGAPSDVVSAKGSLPVDEVPYITSGINIDNKTIQLTWEFSTSKNTAIKGFNIERSEKPKGIFVPVAPAILPSTARQYIDKSPAQINYYRVTAQGNNGEKFVSALYYAQLVDSIPPLQPQGLKAVIDDEGTVQLSWTPNTDIDIFGYRVYKSNNKSEEMAQLTNEPVAKAAYVDKANLKTLNEYVYYRVVAIDRNQNQSALSDQLQVSLPDKIKPQPPVFLPVKNSVKGVLLTWTRSGSDDVQQYDVYRQPVNSKQWLRLKIIPVTTDTAYQYLDETSEPGKINRYTVVAVDEAKLESDPAQVVTGVKLDNVLKPAVEWKPHIITMEKNQVTLNWSYEVSGVKTFRIYRTFEGSAIELYKTMPAASRNFTDNLMPGKKYTYQVLAVFENDNQSKFSNELIIAY